MVLERGRLLFAVSLIFVAAAAWAQQDVAGSTDHPLISRYPGSYIDLYSAKEFDEYTLPLSRLDAEHPKNQHLEGKLTRIHYTMPAKRSPLEVVRNYQEAFRRAGFETLFTCSGEQCGGGSVGDPNGYGWCGGCSPRQVTAKLGRPAGDVYVSLHIEEDNPDTPAWGQLDIIEMKPMESGMVTVNAASLASDITRTGHASVYGIYFDTGKADVKPESDAMLKEVAKLLQQDAKLKLYVVGHTDNQGALEANLDLSKRRADAVVQVLTGKYTVAAIRLRSLGDGPSAPVASNDSEDGRAKNRRVELVKQ